MNKLLFSKADKVDLLFSQHLVFNGENISFEAKSSPSLKATIDFDLLGKITYQECTKEVQYLLNNPFWKSLSMTHAFKTTL